jgi:hypothetical protein
MAENIGGTLESLIIMGDPPRSPERETPGAGHAEHPTDAGVPGRDEG